MREEVEKALDYHEHDMNYPNSLSLHSKHEIDIRMLKPVDDSESDLGGLENDLQVQDACHAYIVDIRRVLLRVNSLPDVVEKVSDLHEVLHWGLEEALYFAEDDRVLVRFHEIQAYD